MKRHLNTLFVTTQGAYLATEGETVVVRHEEITKGQIPLHMLEGIICFGRVACSPVLMSRCCERGVGLTYLTEHGRFLARVEGPVSGNVLLRRAQYRAADDETTAARIARSFVLAKVANARTVLHRVLRDHPENAGVESVRQAAAHLAESLSRLQNEASVDSARGIEGDAAGTYFSVFDHLLVAQKDMFFFRGRNRRPPLDNVNALLSFIYVLLTHDAASALESVGLDPQVGFLHCDRPGRPGLALDLIEEFRPFLADRLVLSLVNRRQVDASGFTTNETGGVTMTDETRRTVLVAYQERKEEKLRHPFLDEEVTVGMLPHLQALLLARFLRGDLDDYPPFLWR